LRIDGYAYEAEAKSLALDGGLCEANTAGLLRRAVIAAGDVIPASEETDRHWEQGEDPGVTDSNIQVYGPTGRLVVADPSDRKNWAKIGVRRLMRSTNLTQKTIYAIFSGKGVRPHTLAALRSAADLHRP
jgi:hypothetical protein